MTDRRDVRKDCTQGLYCGFTVLPALLSLICFVIILKTLRKDLNTPPGSVPDPLRTLDDPFLSEASSSQFGAE